MQTQPTHKPDVTDLLQAPWPTDPSAITAHCQNILTLIQTSTTSSAWTSALDGLSHQAWWTLWLHAQLNSKRKSETIDPALTTHLSSRRAHLYDNPSLLAEVLAHTTLATPKDRSEALCILAFDGEMSWSTHAPSAVVRFVEHVLDEPDLTPDRPWFAHSVWTTLMDARNTADTPELIAATQQLWNNRHIDRSDALISLVSVLGHTPTLLDGFLPPRVDAHLMRQIMGAISDGYGDQPPHMSVMLQLVEGQPKSVVADMLHGFLMGRQSFSWLSQVLDTLWDRAGLNDADRTQQAGVCGNVMSSLAFLGMTEEFGHRLNQSHPMTQCEKLVFVHDLALQPNDNVPAAVLAVLSRTPTEECSALLQSFVDYTVCNRFQQGPGVLQTIGLCWGLVDENTARTLWDAQPKLHSIPEVAAWHQKSVLHQHTHRHDTPARAPKM